MVDKLLDATRELLNKALVKKQKDRGVPEGNPLKKKLGSAQFAYFHGITKQPIREERKALSILKINSEEVKDTSSAGKRVCAILTTSAYVPTLMKRIVIEEGAIMHLERFYSLSPNNLKRAKGAQNKLPEWLLIQRAAYTTNRATVFRLQ